DAQLWTPYGATECLPVAAIEGRELQRTRQATERGAGTCVGLPVAPNVVRIVRIVDAPLPQWSDDLALAPGEIGEITIAGPTATDSYFNRDAATRAAKIREVLSDGGERTVHRMGDVGYFDAQGRLWFCGRKTQRVETAHGTLHTEQVEPVFNLHPEVRRTALVGIGEHGSQRPVLCFELRPGIARSRRAAVADALRAIAAAHAHTARIERFLWHPRFPVDIRHNAKIGRETLAAWAAARAGMP
ncbi:MAG TPA: peptide synthase, partial [Pseudoxanthomonas sp.]|nr:peptide synthase [Pseudoxanthomonas sp.]